MCIQIVQKTELFLINNNIKYCMDETLDNTKVMENSFNRYHITKT